MKVLQIADPKTKRIYWNKDVKDNFKLYEIYKACKGLRHERWNWINKGIPLTAEMWAMLDVAQLTREETGHAVTIGSFLRSYAWEIFRKRSGKSQHLKGAIDLGGHKVHETYLNALKRKNLFYRKIKAKGANRFIFYSWGVHVDAKKTPGNADVILYDSSYKGPRV